MHLAAILPTKKAGACPEGILAAAVTAERLGWRTVWADDHVLVPRSDAKSYGTIFELISTLAWVGGQTSRIRLGTGVVVIPQRNALIVAKELASVDRLTGGRVVAGLGLGWNEQEFRNLGVHERFRVRGAYLDETIHLFRHLWSGTEAPFHGRFFHVEDAVMGPLPVHGAATPIFVGGRSDHAVRRAGRLGDGYHLSQNGPEGFAARLPLLRASAAEAGRPVPPTSARAQVYFGEPPAGHTPAAMHGSAQDIIRTLDAWEALGLDELAVDVDETDPDRCVAKMERFQREVVEVRAARG